MSQNIKYRVWEVENPPSEPNYFPAKDPLDGARIIKREIINNKAWYIWGDAFGLEYDDGTGWCEWYNEMGEDVNEAFGLG